MKETARVAGASRGTKNNPTGALASKSGGEQVAQSYGIGHPVLNDDMNLNRVGLRS